MREQQNPSTPELHQPLLFAPSELLACGLRDAHHHPLVGVRTEDGVRSWRTSPATAWEHPLVEWARTATSYCSIVLDCDSRESQELACAVEAGYGDLPRPNVAAQRASSGHLHLGWNLRTPVHSAARCRDRGHSRHSAALRSTTRSRSDRTVAMWASWPTTRSIPTTRPSIRALSPTTWRSWLELYRPTGDGQRERRTWYRHRGATAICSRRSASWPLADRTRAC